MLKEFDIKKAAKNTLDERIRDLKTEIFENEWEIQEIKDELYLRAKQHMRQNTIKGEN